MIPYAEAWDLQARLVEARVSGSLPNDVVLVLEHPAVFTLGKRGGRENLLVPEETLARQGIPIVQVERGGNITYHAPGQLVLYPIIHLERAGIKVVDMVDRLEEVMIRTCAEWGIQAGRNPLNRGVWVGMKKIGAIGIAVRRGVSFHGMALNVNIRSHAIWLDPALRPGGGRRDVDADGGWARSQHGGGPPSAHAAHADRFRRPDCCKPADAQEPRGPALRGSDTFACRQVEAGDLPHVGIPLDPPLPSPASRRG